MTTFNYSSGDPSDLTGGAPASMSDISGPLADLVTFLNGNIDTANLATSAKPVTLLGQYRTICEAQSMFDDSLSGNPFLFRSQFIISPSATAYTTGNGYWPAIVALNSADYAVSGLTTKFRLRAGVLTNATAPARTFTFGLYPLTLAGAADTITPTMGTVTSGSTVAIASPGASAGTIGAGSDFTPPSSGIYALGIELSGVPAASSAGIVYARLDVRHV